MNLTEDQIKSVVNACNRDLVPDKNYDKRDKYKNLWFENYFSFLGNKKLEQQLGEAFYEARFQYKLMSVLRLPFGKNKGIVKFQIIQYASICEALLEETFLRFFKEEAEAAFSVIEYTPDKNALARDVVIERMKNGRKSESLVICHEKRRKGDIKRTRVMNKTTFAVDKGIIADSTKNKIDALYDLRNNVHILKAAEREYQPKIYEAKDAFVLMREVTESVKEYYELHKN